MRVTLRAGAPQDAAECGRINYQAFKAIAEQHNFPPDFPSVEVATAVISMLLGHPGFYKVVAEADGRIVGSNFLDERSSIAGVGPITVDPAVQNQAIGRQLMLDVMARAETKRFAGVRLVQAAYHARSLSLYTKLGFNSREELCTFQGAPPGIEIPGRKVRSAQESDLEACNRLCRSVHGFDRGSEVVDAIGQGSATVVEHAGRITGYSTSLAWFGHSVAEANDDLEALIAAAKFYAGPGFLAPVRNGELMRWCLGHGLRVRQVNTLMTIGLYQEPEGAWLPSVLY